MDALNAVPPHRSRPARRRSNGRTRRGTPPSGRRRRLALVAAAVMALAACCPVPTASLGEPTAFRAVVAWSAPDGAAWSLGLPDGRRIAMSGGAPAPTGAPVYVRGRWRTNGTLDASEIVPFRPAGTVAASAAAGSVISEGAPPR